MVEICLAVLLGLLFGFALNRAGATNPQYIINMVRLNNLHLMKTILFAIGLSAIGLFGGLAIGVIDPSHLSVKTAYIGVILGGAIMGIGFAIAGYCPGTGLAAIATGRKDAIFFVLGGLLGALTLTLSYGWLKENTPLFDKIAGGNTTLAGTGNEKYVAIFETLDGVVVGGLIGILFIGIAFLLPKQILK